MDDNLLLLLSREVSHLSEPLQRQLYIQFVDTLARSAAPAREAAAAQAAIQTFKQAVGARRPRGSRVQLAARLIVMFERNAAAISSPREGVMPAACAADFRLSPANLDEPEFGGEPPDEHLRILRTPLPQDGGQAVQPDAGTTPREPGWTQAACDAWPELHRFLLVRKRRLKRVKTMLTAGLFALMLITGGVAFGTSPPAAGPADGEYDSASDAFADLPAGTAVPVQTTELKLPEQEMKKFTAFRMLVPGYLPSGYRYDEGVVWLTDGKPKSDHAMLVYTNENGYLLRVTFYRMSKNSVLSTGAYMPETTEEMFVRSSRALFVTSKDGYFTLSWSENETFMQLSGRGLSKADVLKMAEGLR